MEPRTKGAWLVHHAQKLQLNTTTDFENVAFAGKAAILLSAISGSRQNVILNGKLRSLAKANGISAKTELPLLVDEFVKQKLLEKGKDSVEVKGITSASVMEYASRIFDESEPEAQERAAVEVANQVSERPQREVDFIEKIQDTFGLSKAAGRDFLRKASDIGFFDTEALDSTEKVYFNGNLFRRDGLKKVTATLDSLKPHERVQLSTFQDQLAQSGCLTLEAAEGILGKSLLAKIQSIGLIDVSGVGNEHGQHRFVTSPAAFSKFTNSIADDALDLSKALVAALTYGMTKSAPGRGRIMALTALMDRLINGRYIGPATAIGQDYKVLEFKGVIDVRPQADGRFTMRLLKPEVGRLALAVLHDGGVIPTAMQPLSGANVSVFIGPELNRSDLRKNTTPALKSSVASILDDLRTGAFR